MLKKIVKFFLVSIALFLIALPYGAKYGGVYYLENNMQMKANIGDVSFNLFSGKVGLQNVHIYGEEMGELHLGKFLIDLDVMALFEKNILVETINFHDFKANVTELEKSWNVGGFNIPLPENDEVADEKKESPESQPFDWGYGVRTIAFSNIKVDVASQYTDSEFVLNEFKLKNLLSWYPANISDLVLDLSVNDEVFRIDGEASPFKNDPIVKANIRLNDVQIKPFLKSIKDLPFDEARVSVFSDFDLEVVSSKDALQLSINGNYGLKDIFLKDQVREIKLRKLFWDGAQKITLPKQGVKLIDLDGLIALENIDVVDTENKVHVRQKKVELAGQYAIELDESADQPKINVLAALNLDRLDIDSLDGKAKLAAFDQWAIKKIDVKSIEDVIVGSSELHNLILLDDLKNQKTPTVAKLEKFLVSKIHYQKNKVEIAKIDFRSLVADVRLNKQGDIPALMPFMSEKKPAEDKMAVKPEKSVKAAKKDKFDIVFNEIVFNSGSKIRFVDKSVTPVFDTQIHDLKLSIKHVNTQKPKQPVKIRLSAGIDEYAKLKIKGQTRPFGKKANANLLINLDSLELVPLSSYAGKFAGINIKRGTLDLKADIKVKNDILNVKNTFYMNQLNVESDDSEVSDNIFKDMPMPLDLTLDVLRDKNDVIKLDIPVKGDVNNPDFRLQDVYNTAMAKAMKFAATHYLMQAVQPLGLIITAGKLAGKAMVPKFDPLEYSVGSAEISEKNKKHIKKLANILQEKNKLRFTICGNATESDWQFFQANKESKEAKFVKVKEAEKNLDTRKQILLALANDRTKRVKKHFVDTYKIAPKRLLACNGKISKDKKDKMAKPMVELTL